MIEYWELQVEENGKWTVLDRFDEEPEADALIEMLRGCPTNDGLPRKFRKRRFAVTNIVEGTF